MRNLCIEDNCTKEVVGNGLCRKHYMRMKRKGNTDDQRKNQRPLCSEGDGKPAVALGLCDRHYRAVRAAERGPITHPGRICDWCTQFIPIEMNRATKFCSKQCKYNRMNELKRLDPEYKNKTRRYRLKRAFNLTQLEWDKMFEAQNGCCAICEKHQSEFDKIFHVDHSHKTGKIRRLLCHNCNAMIGHAKEDIETLKKAVIYLEKYGTIKEEDLVNQD